MTTFYDRERHYYIEARGALLTTSPRVVFARKRPQFLLPVAVELVDRVLYHFNSAVDKHGGDPAAINLLQEYIMSAKGANLVVLTGAVIGNFGFPNDAVAFAATKEGSVVLDEAAFGKLSVDERCKLSRPMLNESESAKTQDGEGFAKQAWKVAARFKNPKVTKEKAAKPAKESAPRKKGVKTLISEMFTTGDGPATLHLSVEEIMAATTGTKASVTTAISDLRSTTYCGKGGVVKLERIGGKYALEGGAASAKAHEADKAVQAKVDAEKKVKKEAADAEKKAKAEAEAAEKAAEAK